MPSFNVTNISAPSSVTTNQRFSYTVYYVIDLRDLSYSSRYFVKPGTNVYFGSQKIYETYGSGFWYYGGSSYSESQSFSVTAPSSTGTLTIYAWLYVESASGSYWLTPSKSVNVSVTQPSPPPPPPSPQISLTVEVI